MPNLFDQLAALLEAGEAVAVATIARTRGSSPRSGGTRCGVRADGAVIGTIGGGLLEARTQESGREALTAGQLRVLPLRMDSLTLADSGMVCGGSVEVVVAPWAPSCAPLARAAARALDSGEEAVLVLSWRDRGRAWRAALYRGGELILGEAPLADPAAALAEATASGRPAMSGDAAQGLVADPLLRERAPLLILGAGHVGRAIAQVAALAQFAVTVADDRPEFADPDQLPWAERVVCHPFPGVLDAALRDPGTYVVVCTRGHLSDAECTAQALRSPAPYVGVIGSRRKRAMVLEHLRGLGIAEARLEALHMPVGLAIGAETPEEIAVSVVAELIRTRRGG